MQILFLVMLFIVGSCLGSFLCCQARRLHLGSAKSTAPRKPLGSRSICLSCHRQLKWYDNLPIISWLILGGKCRYCHRKIGCAEILSEVGLGLSFLCLGATINVDTTPVLTWFSFITILLFMIILGFLAIYDGLYGELPTLALYLSIGIAIISTITREIATPLSTFFTVSGILSLLFSILILGGTYLLLYLVSKGKWVGDGDWLLATAIAIVLPHPWLAVNALFVANLIACIVMLPITRREKTHQIHLGPFLVIGFVIVYSTANFFFSLISV